MNEIVFLDKLLWNIFKADLEKLWSIHRSGLVKIADVKICKARIAAGEDAVDYVFNKFERAGWCANVPGVTDAVSSNGDPRSVRIFFMGPVFAQNLSVRNFVAAVDGAIFVLDDPESVSSLDALFFGAFRSLTYDLAQASQFV